MSVPRTTSGPRLVHMTEASGAIRGSGKLGLPSDLYAGPASNVDLSDWALTARTGLSPSVSVPLTASSCFLARAADTLREHRKQMLADGHAGGGSPVFCDADGGFLRRPNVTRRSFHPLIEEAAVPRIRFHDLRHTAATLMLLGGVDVKVVSKRLGHASIEITLSTYAHVLPNQQREAAEKMNVLWDQVRNQ